MTVVTYGKTEPRVWTKPLRQLTSKSSRGFEVIAFAKDVLGVDLYPWQEWLLQHMLELNEDGTLRFRKALVIVGRQCGKTLMGAILAAYWLYVDSGRWPQYVPEENFVIVGAAQKLDIALKPWKQVRSWGAPYDPKIGHAPEAVPMLQSNTYPPRMSSGEVELRTHGGAAYLPRTFEGARGQSAARLLLDELREQYDYEGWAAIEKSSIAQFDSQLVAFSNAGTARSVVLRDVRNVAHKGVDDPSSEWFLAEWSADPKAGLDDPEAFAQASPSAGYRPGMTIQGLMRTAANAETQEAQAVERTEVLGQWITAKKSPLIPVEPWSACADAGSEVMAGSELALAVDVDFDRRYTAVAVAGWRDDGLPHVEAIAHRAGIVWAPEFIGQVAEAQGIRRVAVRSRGAAASELVDPLERLGLEVVRVEGPADGQAAGQIKDAVLSGQLRHRGQPPLDVAVAGAEPSIVGGVEVFERRGAAVSTAPIIACAYALYALRRDPVVSVSAYEPDEDSTASGPWWRRG